MAYQTNCHRILKQGLHGIPVLSVYVGNCFGIPWVVVLIEVILALCGNSAKGSRQKTSDHGVVPKIY